MILNGFVPVFVVGCLGGAAAEAVKWIPLRESQLPDYFRMAHYWIITLVVIVLGGGLATIYGVGSVNAVLAVNIGASFPLIVSKLASVTPVTTYAGSPRVSASEESSGVLRGWLPPASSVLDILAGR